MRLFIRHAQSYANVSGVLDPREFGGNITGLGQQQAHSTSLFISGIRAQGDITDERVISSSPHTRCIETSSIIAGQLGVPAIEIKNALCVRGLGSAIGRDREYRRQFDTYDCIPGSERTQAFMYRVLSIIEEPYPPLISVTHSGVISAIRYVFDKGITIDDVDGLEHDCYRKDYDTLPKVPNGSVWKLDNGRIEMLFSPTQQDQDSERINTPA